MPRRFATDPGTLLLAPNGFDVIATLRVESSNSRDTVMTSMCWLIAVPAPLSSSARAAACAAISSAPRKLSGLGLSRETNWPTPTMMGVLSRMVLCSSDAQDAQFGARFSANARGPSTASGPLRNMSTLS